MATARKIGGYSDRYELNRAVRANKRARDVVAKLLEMAGARRGAGWIYPLLAALAQHLSEVLEALTEMERIRNQSKGDKK